MIALLALAVTLTVSELWIPLLAALNPLLTAFITKPESSNQKRAIVSIVLNAALAAINLAATGAAFTPEALLVTFLTAMVVSTVTYLSVWKPIVHVNETVAPDVGI